MDTNKFKEFLLKKRIVLLTSEINNDLVLEVKKSIFELVIEDSKKPINLVVDCIGGDVKPALFCYDFIKSMPCEVNASIIGRCYSSALVIICACKQRIATTHSRFKFHAMSVPFEVKGTKDIKVQIKHNLEGFKILYEQVLLIQTKAFNLSEEELILLIKQGEKYNVMLTAKQALEKGVIHGIVEKFNFLNNVDLNHDIPQ